MLTWTKKCLASIVAANVAAVIVGVGAAATFEPPFVAAASATHNCTHYTPTYFTGDTASQAASCYAYQSNPTAWYFTDGIAPRDQNMIGFEMVRSRGSFGMQIATAATTAVRRTAPRRTTRSGRRVVRQRKLPASH